MKTKDLNPAEFNPYYATYINQVPEDQSLIEGFQKGKEAVVQFFKSIPQEKLGYRYSEDKWSIKEILQHIVDTERIFMYRCLRLGRNDATPLAGFDQNVYVEPSMADDKDLDTILNEYTTTRDSFVALVEGLSDENLAFIGTASGGAMSAKATAFIILGHEIHHMRVIKERYL